MKKNLLKIAVIIFAVIFLLLLLDYVCYYTYIGTKRNYKCLSNYISKFQNLSEKEIYQKHILDSTTNRYVPLENKNSKLKPVLLFGFSDVRSAYLSLDENISKYLAKNTNRPIYNRVGPESTVNHMYYQLSNDNFYNLIPKPQYVLYFYRKRQMLVVTDKMDFCQHDFYYSFQNDKLNLIRGNLVQKSYLMSWINRKAFRNSFLRSLYINKNKKLFTELMKNSFDCVQKKWGKDVEFVIVQTQKIEPCEKEMFNELQKYGFKLFDLNERLASNEERFHVLITYCMNSLYWEKAARIISEELITK